MNRSEAHDHICEALRAHARHLLETQCKALQSFGASVAVFNAAETGVVDGKDRPLRTVVFMATGVFTDEDLRRLRDTCIGATQDATMGEHSEVMTMEDNLPPAPAAPEEGGA
jgi:hypothetical protein